MAKVALVDDHVLLRNGLAGLVANFGHTVLFEADNGREFIKKMATSPLPELILLDINMPEMDGFETALWLKQHHPGIKILSLSMYDNEPAILRMLKNGAKGYILKDCDPSELNLAINTIMNKDFYASELVSGKLINALNNMDAQESAAQLLTDKERQFLVLACTEFTYKEIADKMIVSPRTVDGYRDSLFQKLNVKTRVGLAVYALRNNIENL